MHSRVGFCWLLGPFPAPPGPKAAMRTGLVGSVGRLCGSALCGGHRGDGAALAGRRGRVVCRLLCRKMGGGARGARIRCSEGGRRCWRCGGMAWGRWRMRTSEDTSGDVRANLGGHPAPRPPGDRRLPWLVPENPNRLIAMLCDVDVGVPGQLVEHTLQLLCSTAPPHAMHTTVISNLDHRGSRRVSQPSRCRFRHLAHWDFGSQSGGKNS